MLSDEVLKWTDTIRVDLPTLPALPPHCMVYWRGNRQEARVKDGEKMVLELKRPGFFPERQKTTVIIETYSDKRIVVAKADPNCTHQSSHPL